MHDFLYELHSDFFPSEWHWNCLWFGRRKGKRKERREATVEREGGAQTQRWCDGHRCAQVAERCACVFGSSSTLFQSSSLKSPSLRKRTNTQVYGPYATLKVTISVFCLIFFSFLSIFGLISLLIDRHVFLFITVITSQVIPDPSMQGKGPCCISYPYNQASSGIWLWCWQKREP